MALNPPRMGAILTDDLMVDDIQIACNGLSYGNIIILSAQNPRQSDNYLRVTAPIGLYNTEIENIRLLEMRKYSGNKLIVAPGGGGYYDGHDNMIIGCFRFSPIVFDEKNENYTPSLKFVVAYLKSSIAIWYAERCLGSYDLRKNLIQNMPLPDQVALAFQEKVENLVDILINREVAFLEAETQLAKKSDSPDMRRSNEFKNERNILIQGHNNEANRIMGKIDELFYWFFGLSDNLDSTH